MVFSSASLVIARNQESTQTIILESYTPKLGTNDTIYLKFKNSTGIYETTNGETTELESFVEDEWVKNYRDYMKRKAKHDRDKKNAESFRKTSELFLNLITFPFALLVSPFYDMVSIIGTETISAIEQTAPLVQESVQDLSVLTQETFDKTIEDFAPPEELAGLGSELPNIKYHINDNATHNFIEDPTNQTDGYYLAIDVESTELNASRGQTYRHFYNSVNGSYTFSSDSLYNQTDTLSDTDWVLEEEFIFRYIIRLTNGSIYFRETPVEMNTLISSITNSTIWAVGYESLSGVMAFYLNFADTDWGHGQYLWYSRLRDGSLPAYNKPQYGLYPHLFAKFNDQWYDKLLNDRSLYDQPNKNPRNTLQFFSDGDTIGLFFDTPNITILSSNWNFRHGFKYNSTDRLFHMINEFECVDRDFQDIGFGYEITSSPQSDGTQYEPDHIVIKNDTYAITVSMSEAWQAGTYLEDFYSQIDIISTLNERHWDEEVLAWNATVDGVYQSQPYVAGHWVNETESFPFTFTDMEDAGFTQKYLELHNQLMPDGSTRKTLLAGMYGYGSYTNQTWVTIDPTITDYEVTDNYDLYYHGEPFPDTWVTTSTYVRAGAYTGEETYEGYIAWNTGIEVKVVGTYTVAIEIYVVSETMESGDGWSGRVYNVKGNTDSNQARENSLSRSYTAYTDIESGIIINPSSGAYRTMDTTKSEALTDYWGANRDNDDEYISFQFTPYACEFDTDDRINAADDHSGTNEARITFTYDLNTAPVTSIDTSIGSADHFAGIEMVAEIDYTDVNGRTDLDTIYCTFGAGNTGTNDLRLYIDSDVGAGTYTPSDVDNTADNYLYSAEVVLGNTATGYHVTWTVIWKFGYAYYDDSATMDTRAICYDDSSANSGWVAVADNTEIEDDLEITDWAISIDGAYEYGGLNSWINNGDYFSGGHLTVTTGNIDYEGSSQTFSTNTQAGNGVTIVLNWNGADSGEYDSGMPAGEFSISWTPTAGDDYTAGTYDADCDWEVVISMTAGSDVSTGNLYNGLRDNIAPTMTDCYDDATLGGDTGEMYAIEASDKVFFSNSFDTAGTIIFEADVYDANSGVRGVDYGAFGADNPVEDTSHTPYSGSYTINTDDTTGTITVIVYDNVGNSGSDTITMTEDADGPVVTMDWNFAANTYAPLSGGHYFYNDIDFDSVQDAVSGLTAVYLNMYDDSATAWQTSQTIASGLAGDTAAKTYNDKVRYYTNNGLVGGSYLGVEYDENDDYVYGFADDMVGNRAGVGRYTRFDNVAPVLGTTSFDNEDYDGDWFDQGDTATAIFNIPFTEAGTVSSIAVVCTLDAADRAADWSSGATPFKSSITITGRTDVAAAGITVIITDAAGHTDSTFAGISEINLDNTPPTYSLALTADGATIGYTPNTGFYDDNSVDVDATDSPTETGSGLPTNHYGFQRASEGWSGYQASDTYSFTSTSDGDWTFYVRVVDNVGNIGISQSTTATVDISTPTGFSVTESDLLGWGSSDYAYLSGSDINFKNNAGSQTFTIQVNNDGTIGNSDYWQIDWDVSDVFGESYGRVSWDGVASASKAFDYQNDVGGTGFLVRVINNAGNYQTFTYTTDDDQTAPTTTASSPLVTEGSPNTYIYYDGSVTVYHSNLMGATDQKFTISVTAGDTGGAGLYGVLQSAWDGVGGTYDTAASPYTLEYTTDSGEGAGTISFTAYDQVGNFDASAVDVTMDEDILAPAISVTFNFNTNDYATKASTNFGYTDVDVTSTQDTGAGLESVRINIYDHSATAWGTTRYIASGLAGDNSEKAYLNEYRYYTDDGETGGSYLDDEYDASQDYMYVGSWDMVGNYGGSQLYTKLDRTAPSGGSWSTDYDGDDDTADGYTPYGGSYGGYEAFYDEASYTADASSWVDSGSGIDGYYIKRNGGSYGSKDGDGTAVGCTLTANANDIYYKVTDVVGNEVADVDTAIDVYYSTTAPVTFDIDIIGTAEWTSGAPSYAWITDATDITSGTLYLGDVGDTTWSINMDKSGTWNAGGEWKVAFEAGWGGALKTDDDGTYTSNTYHSNTGAEADITVDIVNRNGVALQRTLTTTADTSAPTIGSFDLTLDPDSDDHDRYNDITPQTGYYDDDSVDISFTGSVTESGSSLNTNPYSYKYNGGSYGSYTGAGGTVISVPEGAQTIYVKVVDKVGNVATDLDSVVVHVETGVPVSNTPVIDEISGNDYIYAPNGSYLYYTDTGSQFKVTGSFSSNGGSGEYAVRFTIAFDLGANNTDTASAYENIFQIDPADTDTVLYLVFFNNGGNSAVETIVLEKDTDAPADGDNDVTDIAESSVYLYDVGGLTDIWYGNDMPSGVSFTVTVGTYGDDKSGIWKMVSSDNLGEGAKTDTTGDYTFTWTPTSGDTDTTAITITAYDYVSNSRVIDTITVHRDTTVDAPTISSLSESSESLHTSGTTTFWYSEVMGTTVQQLTVTIGATDSGGSGVLRVRFPAKFGESQYDDGSPSYSSTFDLTSADSDTGSITMTSFDNVGNENTISFTAYKDTTKGTTSFWYFVESSFYISTSGSTVYYSDESFSGETITLRVKANDTGGNPSGVYKVLFGTWDEQNPSNDTGGAYWERDYTLDGDDSSGSIIVKMYDNVGNLESTLTITMTRLTDAPTVEITTVAESSEWLYAESLTQFWYGDDMSSAQSVTITGTVNYAGVDGISHVNSTAVWFGDSPSDSTDTYDLVFTVENTDTDSGTMTIIVWNNTGKNGTDTITISRDTTDPNPYSLSSPTYDGDGNVTVTGSTTDDDSGMRTSNAYEWWVNSTRDFGSGNWTNSGSYEFQGLPEANHTFYAAAYDYVGNWQNATIDFTIVDFTAPEIYWTYLTTDNTTAFYLETTNNTDQTVVYIYYNPSIYTFSVFLNFTAWDVGGGSIVNVTYNARFGDSPTNDTGNYIWYNATYTIPIDHSPEDGSNSTTVIATAVDNVGLTATVTIYFYRDLDAPTLDLTIDNDPHALLDLGSYYGWYNDTTVDVTVNSPADGDHPPNVGLPATRYQYKFNNSGGDNAYGSWKSSVTNQEDVSTAGTWWMWVKVRDILNNTREYNVTVYVDLTNPSLGVMDWKDPTFSENFYRAIDNEANWNFTWTEANPYLVNATNTPLGYTESDSNPSGSVSDFTVTITGKSDGYYNITVTMFDNAGNRDVYTATGNTTLYIDNTAPTINFNLNQDAQRLVDNYYSAILVYTTTSAYSDGVNGSGAPATQYSYRKEGFGWSIYTDVTVQSWTGNDQTNVTLYAKARDNMGWESTVNETWVIVDTIAPVLGWLTLNETFAPNWYDQSISNVAQAQIYWVDNYPFDVDATCTLSHTDDNSPSGGVSYINLTITGEADGSYSVAIRIRDNAGNEDTTLIGTEAPIQLESGMSGFKIEDWVLFNYYDNEGFLIEWNTFNSSYVIDESYRNYTEQPMLNNEFYTNITSSVRIITRSVFNDVIYNETTDLTTRTLFLILDVYTFKVSNIHDEVMNMTITKAASSRVYTEQIMPYEIFGWQMYIGSYNVSVIIHGTIEYAYDESNNELNNYTITLTDGDYAMFIDANLRFTVDMIISEIWQFNIFSNKDYKTNLPSFDIYLNDSSQGTGNFNPGTIVLSRPQVGYYNLTIFGEWQNYNDTYQQFITVESNAEITNFVLSGLESTSDEIYISWNTNKGTGSMTTQDNSSLVQTNALEGNSLLEKSSSIGLHQLIFNITVETKVFSYYANYTIADWTVAIVMTIYDSETPTVSVTSTSLPKRHTVDITVTRSDGEQFSGYVYINSTKYTIVNGAGSFIIDNDAVTSELYNVTSVQDLTAKSRGYVSETITVIYDKLYGSVFGSGPTFTVYFNSTYTDEAVDNFRYKVKVGGGTKLTSQTGSSFTINSALLAYGEYDVEVYDVENTDNFVNVGSYEPSTYTKARPPVENEGLALIDSVFTPSNWPMILLGIVIIVIVVAVVWRVFRGWGQPQPETPKQTIKKENENWDKKFGRKSIKKEQKQQKKDKKKKDYFTTWSQ